MYLLYLTWHLQHFEKTLFICTFTLAFASSASRYCLCSMLEQILCVCFWDTKSRFCGAGKGDRGRLQSLPRKKAVGIALLPVVIDVLLINRSSSLHVTMTDTAAGYNHGPHKRESRRNATITSPNVAKHSRHIKPKFSSPRIFKTLIRSFHCTKAD